MFMLISLVNKKSNFYEEKHFSNKNNLRKGYGEFSTGEFSSGKFTLREFDKGEFSVGKICNETVAKHFTILRKFFRDLNPGS